MNFGDNNNENGHHFVNRVRRNQIEALQFQYEEKLQDFQYAYQDISNNHARHIETLGAKVRELEEKLEEKAQGFENTIKQKEQEIVKLKTPILSK